MDCLKAHRAKVARVCGGCGVSFLVFQAQIRRGGGKFCSRKCASLAISTKEKRSCLICGVKFLIKQCELKRGKLGVGSYCSNRCKAHAMSKSTRTVSGRIRNSNGGKRADLDGLYVRSSWEANWARYLNWLVSLGEIASWEYEPDTFEFPVKRGSKFYTPDFKLISHDGSIEYHEVKGYMDRASLTKLARMKRHYPDVKLIVVAARQYHAVAKACRTFIKEWE